MRRFETENFFDRFEFSVPHVLSASDPDAPTLGELCRLIGLEPAELAEVSLAYTPVGGDLALREAIASYVAYPNPAHVLFLNAPEEGIYLAVSAAARKRVVVLKPCYDSLAHVAENLGAEVVPWPLRRSDDRWALDLPLLERLLATDTDLLVLNFPHNPTGFLPTPEAFETVLAMATKAGATVFCDEMYAGLELGARLPLKSACRFANELAAGSGRPGAPVMTLGGLSKCVGLPGLRAGWLIVPDDALRERIVQHKLFTTICAPALGSFLTQRVLPHAAELQAQHRACIERNIEAVTETLARHAGFSWIPPQAGTVGLAESPWPDAEKICHALGHTHGVLALPGAFMGAAPNTLRIGLGRRRLTEALARFEQALPQLGG